MARLILQIAEVEGGDVVARDILHMRFFADRNAKLEISPDLIEAGRALLRGIRFGRGRAPHSLEDHALALIVRVSLASDGGQPIVQSLCRMLVQAMTRYEVGPYDYDDLIQSLFEVHPVEMLDTLFSGDEPSRRRSAALLNDLPRAGKLPMSEVSDEVVIAWCERIPDERYAFAATFVQLFEESGDETPANWTVLSRRLLSDAPDPIPVFEAIVGRLYPTSWSGSLAGQFAARLALLDRLDIKALPVLQVPMAQARAALQNRVERERRYEQEEEQERDGRFE